MTFSDTFISPSAGLQKGSSSQDDFWNDQKMEQADGRLSSGRPGCLLFFTLSLRINIEPIHSIHKDLTMNFWVTSKFTMYLH